MSSPRNQPLRCPRCGEAHEAVVHDVVDAAAEPALKAELLSTRLFQHACPACGERWHAARTLLYRDTARGLLCWLYTGDATDEARRRLSAALDAAVGPGARASSTLRLVGDPRDLIEKVLVFAAGLSDMIVEVVKVFAAGLAPAARGAKLRFSPPRSGDLVGQDLPFAVIKPGEKVERMGVPWAHYVMATERFPGLMVAAAATRGELITIDEAFALDTIRAGGSSKGP